MLRQAGFTLMEFIIALAILTAFMAIGAPKLLSHLNNQKLKWRSKELKNIVQYARLQALSLGQRVELKPLSSDTWSEGIGLYTFPEKNTTTAKLIRQWQWSGKIINVTWKGFLEKSLIFSPELHNNALNGRFDISSNEKHYQLIINRLGRVRGVS